MKTTCTMLAIFFGLGLFATPILGQEYFDGLAYSDQFPGQDPREQYAQAHQEQAQIAQFQVQQAQAQQLQFETQRAQQSQFQVQQAQYHAQQALHQQAQHEPDYQQAQVAQTQYAPAQFQSSEPVFQESYSPTFDLSDSAFGGERTNCEFDDCSSPSRLAGVYAGYSFAFTKLYMKESFEAYVSDFRNATQTLYPFDYDYKLTPRIWIGARNERGVGVKASYWNFDQSSNGFQFTNTAGFQIPVAVATSVIFPAAVSGSFPGDMLTVASAVKANTLDFEGTYSTNLGAVETEFSGGVRYARSEQSSSARVDRVIDPVIVTTVGVLDWERKFEGFGPVFNATGRLPMGNRGLYGIGGAGLSFLFGEKTLRRNVQNDVTPFPNTGLPFLNFEEADEISGIYNVRIGLGHKRQTKLGDAFLEGTYEGQLWTDLGAPTLTFAGFNSFNVNLGLNF